MGGHVEAPSKEPKRISDFLISPEADALREDLRALITKTLKGKRWENDVLPFRASFDAALLRYGAQEKMPGEAERLFWKMVGQDLSGKGGELLILAENVKTFVQEEYIDEAKDLIKETLRKTLGHLSPRLSMDQQFVALSEFRRQLDVLLPEAVQQILFKGETAEGHREYVAEKAREQKISSAVSEQEEFEEALEGVEDEVDLIDLIERVDEDKVPWRAIYTTKQLVEVIQDIVDGRRKIYEIPMWWGLQIKMQEILARKAGKKAEMPMGTPDPGFARSAESGTVAETAVNTVERNMRLEAEKNWKLPRYRLVRGVTFMVKYRSDQSFTEYRIEESVHDKGDGPHIGVSVVRRIMADGKTETPSGPKLLDYPLADLGLAQYQNGEWNTDCEYFEPKIREDRPLE